MPQTQTLSPEMQQCIQNCFDCHRSCTETASHCLQMGGKHASADHIRTLLDCAQMCGVSADFMLRQSPVHPQVCGVCAETCRQCAESCSRLADGDSAMTNCAAVCQRCEQSCESMAMAKAA